MKIRIFLFLIFLLFIFISCEKKDFNEVHEIKPPKVRIDPYPSELKDRYIVFFLANVNVDQADNMNAPDGDKRYTFVSELPQYFGPIKKNNPYKYAFGLPGPMLLTQSVDEMKYQVNKAFDIAEKHNIPVYFQLDDCMNYTDAYGSDANPKFYEKPHWCEWVSFPVGDEEWGGQLNGRLPYNWFNWGAWLNRPAFPCFESPGFRSFVLTQMQNGFLNPLTERYNRLISEGREYLLAGVAVGWETHIPDHSIRNVNNLPISNQTGEQMQPWEASKYGYNSLSIKGYDSYNRAALDTVIHDYIELLSKEVFDSGIPKEKIFSHIVGVSLTYASTHYPPMWTAVNDYCTPGFSYSATLQWDLEENLRQIKQADKSIKYFGSVESYTRGASGLERSFSAADEFFDTLFSNGANLVAIFGWGREAGGSGNIHKASHEKSSPFILAASEWLNIESAVK